jgi:hypothetical protein
LCIRGCTLARAAFLLFLRSLLQTDFQKMSNLVDRDQVKMAQFECRFETSGKNSFFPDRTLEITSSRQDGQLHNVRLMNMPTFSLDFTVSTFFDAIKSLLKSAAN